jgi:hypothetical protein
MKKFTLSLMIVAVALFTAAPVFAEGMMFGVKAGIDLANITGDISSITKMKTGMIGGAYLQYNFTEMFAIQPELLFTMKGAGIDIPIVDASIKANYLEIPLLFKITIPTEGKFKPNIYAGPALGILMSAKAEALGVSVDLKDLMKSTNFLIVAGAGVGYMVQENGLLFLEARYEVGLTTVAKDVKFSTNVPFGDWEDEDSSITLSASAAPDIKTSDISILVGYGFSF